MDLSLPDNNTSVFRQPYIPPQYYQNQGVTSLDQQIRQTITVHEETKEEKLSQLFQGSEYDGGREIYYGDLNTGAEIDNTHTKSHFKRLFSLQLPIEVKNGVHAKILASKKRTHVITDDMLCAYTIRVYTELGLPYDIYQIYNIFGVDPSKSNVSELISNCTTKQTILSEEKKSISVMVIKPKDYIKKVLNEYLTKFNIVLPYVDIMIRKLEYFADVMVTICSLLLNKPPLDVASALVYFYINTGSSGLRKDTFSKKIFYSLDGVTKAKFEDSLASISLAYEQLKQTNPNVCRFIYDYSI